MEIDFEGDKRWLHCKHWRTIERTALTAPTGDTPEAHGIMAALYLIIMCVQSVRAQILQILDTFSDLNLALGMMSFTYQVKGFTFWTFASWITFILGSIIAPYKPLRLLLCLR